MRKEFNSMRTIKFLKRNSLCYSNCENYVRNLCDNVFYIKDYEIKEYKEDEKALIIVINGDTYSSYIDTEIIGLVCEKSNCTVRQFFGDDCWTRVLEYLQMKSKVIKT